MSERSRKNIRIIIITLVIFSCTCYILSGLWKKAQTKDSGTNGLSGELTAFLNSQMEDAFFLLPSFWQEEKEGVSLSALLKHSVGNMLPVYAYMENNREEEITEDEIMKEFFRQKEGSDEDDKNIDEEKLDYGEDALHIENSTLAELELENGRYKEQIAGASDGRWEAEGESIGLTQEAEAENIVVSHKSYRKCIGIFIDIRAAERTDIDCRVNAAVAFAACSRCRRSKNAENHCDRKNNGNNFFQ